MSQNKKPSTCRYSEVRVRRHIKRKNTIGYYSDDHHRLHRNQSKNQGLNGKQYNRLLHH